MSTATARQLADLIPRIEALEAAVQQLQRGRARDEIDETLVTAMSTVLPPRFDAVDVIRGRTKSVALAAALDAANLESPREIGRWLCRMADGITLRRDGRGKRGYRWRLLRVSSV